MSSDETGGPRRARHVAPLATGLVFVVVAGACLFSGHGHLPRVDSGNRAAWAAHPDHAPAKSGCSICSIAQHASAEVSAPRGSVLEERAWDPKRSPSPPRAAAPLSDEQPPRAPPRTVIG